MSATIQLKRGTEQNLKSRNPKLAKGEPIVVFCDNGSVRLKIGNGENYFNGLPYTTHIPDDTSVVLRDGTLALKGFDTASNMTVPVKVANNALEWLPFDPSGGILEDVSYNPANNSLIFVWNTSAGQKIDTVQLQEMFSPYTAGNGIDLSDNIIAVKLAEDTEDFLSLDSKGLKVSGLYEAFDMVNVQIYQEASNLQSQLDAISEEQLTQAGELAKLRSDLDAFEPSASEETNKRLDSIQDTLDAAINDISELKNIEFEDFITLDEVDQKINDTLAGVQVSIDRIDGGRITDVASSQ